MRLALREEMQKIDQLAASEYGLSADQLMEEAGALMADRIMALPGLSPSHRIGIFCGPGHNGGDGLVVARKLLEKGFSHTEVWLLRQGRWQLVSWQATPLTSVFYVAKKLAGGKKVRAPDRALPAAAGRPRSAWAGQ